MLHSTFHKSLVLGTLLGSCLLPAQERRNNRPIAITNARILTMEGKNIARGTVLVRNGKIAAVGTDVQVPPGALRIDAEGGTLTPGLVHAWSRAGSGNRSRTRGPSNPRRGRGGFRRSGFRSSSSPGSNKAASKAAEGLYARQEIFAELLESGITTLALAPSGNGFPGQGALLNLEGREYGSLVEEEAAFQVVAPSANSRGKKLIKDSLAKAKKALEARKAPPAKKPETKKPATKTPAKAEKKPTGKTEEKTDPKKDPKPTPKPAPKPKQDPKKKAKPAAKPAAKAPAKRPARKDPNAEALADLLDGKTRAFLAVSSAADLLHYLDCAGEHRFKTNLLATSLNTSRGELTEVLDKLKSLKAPILLSPRMSTRPMRTAWTNPPAELHKAGMEIGFVIGDEPDSVEDTRGALMKLVRHGLPRDAALKGVTLVPAKMLGRADKVGSIKEGKDADLLLWSGDPLDPTAKLLKVWHAGKPVGDTPAKSQ